MMNNERITEAVGFALELHKEQFRKGTGIPYGSHLLAVASLVMECGGDDDECIAALLHDAAEDQGGKATLTIIEGRFGKRVANIVAECSDTFEIIKPDWQERKQQYLNHLPQASESTILVSAADKLHNVRCMLSDYRQLGEILWKRFSTPHGAASMLWYHRELTKEYLRHAAAIRVKPLTDELLFALAEIERLMGERNAAV